jgi:sugar phosphate isomerase/epimerase
MRKIALQLYTVRESAKEDYIGTLKEVAAIGYKGVEVFGGMSGLGGMSAKELRAVMSDLGLEVMSGHVNVDNLNRGLEELLESYVTLGASYVGLAWLPEEYRTEAGYQRAGRVMEKAALQAAKHDLTFVYHNHAFEFDRLNGRYALDALFESTDASLVKSELDVYWVKKGGEDPVAYLKKLNGRAPLVHIKDMTADASQTFEIVGDGVIDFPGIFSVGDANGVDWYIVEQDICPKGEIESARKSYENIVARGWLGS